MSETVQVSPATLRKVITAAAVGNVVEWFDFAVYGFLATTIAKQFFSSADPNTALLQTFAVFAVAFALRPLGASYPVHRIGDHLQHCLHAVRRYRAAGGYMARQ